MGALKSATPTRRAGTRLHQREMSATAQAPIPQSVHNVNDSDLPEGWVGAQLGDCVEILDNLRVPVNSDEREKRKGSIPYYGATGQVGWIDDYLFDEELLLLGEDGAPFLDKSKPIAYIINGKSWVNNHAHVLRAICNLTSHQLLKYSLDVFDFSDYVTGTTRLKLNQSAMRNIPIALPPLEEQKRIVAKVEELLTQVNATRDRLAKVLKILKRFRQAVLAAACCGRLTLDWRKEHRDTESALRFLRSLRVQDFPAGRGGKRTFGSGLSASDDDITKGLPANDEDSAILPDTWCWANLGKLASVRRGRFLIRPRNDPRYFVGPYPFVQIGNLPPEGGLITSFDQTLNKKGLEVSRLFPAGTVLIAIVGATIGNTGVLGFESCCPDSLVAIQGTSIAHSRFIEYYLRCKKHEIREESYASGGQPNINLQTLIPLAVPVAPAAETNEIVRRVEALFKLADAIEKRVEAATKRADKLTQAILGKAFRGELVPTEAELARREGRTYEPASALLERIRKDGS